MSDIVACPSCERKLRIPQELQDQKVKCPACSTTFTPAQGPGAPMPAPPPPRASKRDPDEEPPRERLRSRRDDPDDRDDLEERRPRRRDDEDDDFDDRPRRRKRRNRDYDEHRGGMILALGICAILGFFTIATGPMAWIMGNNDLAEIRSGRMDPEGEGMTQTGRILGMIATILMVGVLLVLCAIVMVVAAVAAN